MKKPLWAQGVPIQEKIEYYKSRTLDDIIAEQAAFYGMTVEEYGKFTHTMAELCESVNELEEPYL